MIQLKRVYEPALETDGYRILVERLWPRGLTKEAAMLDLWLKEIAPSPKLRSWYSHDLSKWDEFQQRYKRELQNNPEGIEKLKKILSEHGMATFVYASKDEQHCSATVLLDYLQRRIDIRSVSN
jgi:uncharacterized protein YeaO (DUF488 family)